MPLLDHPKIPRRRRNIMTDETPKPLSDQDADLQREIRKERTFSLAEAIGRMAGPGAMKGASPIPRIQQAAAQIEDFLRSHLIDPAGGLRVVVLRRVKEGPLLVKNFDQPLVALAGAVQRVLDSEVLLKELVREADVEWGRALGERPHFEKEGRAPHPDDPYTAESVRLTLCKLLEELAGDGR